MTDKKKSKKSKSGKDKKKPKRRTFKGRKLLPNEFTGVQPYAGVARGMNYRGPYRGWVGGAGGGIIGERAPATKVVQDPKLVEQVADLKASLFIAQARAKFAGEHAATKTAQNLDNMQQNMAKNRKKEKKARKQRIDGLGGDVSNEALEELQDRLHDNLFVNTRPMQYGTKMTTEKSESKIFEFGQQNTEPQGGGKMETETIPTKKEKKQASRTVNLTEQERKKLEASLAATGDIEMKFPDDKTKNRVIEHNHIHGRVVSRGGDRDNRDRFKNTTIKAKDRQEQKRLAQKEQRAQKKQELRKASLPEDNIVKPDISASSQRKRGNEEHNQLLLMNGPVNEREQYNLNKVPRFSGPAMDMSLAAQRRREIRVRDEKREKQQIGHVRKDRDDTPKGPLMIMDANQDQVPGVAPEGVRSRSVVRKQAGHMSVGQALQAAQKEKSFLERFSDWTEEVVYGPSTDGPSTDDY